MKNSIANDQQDMKEITHEEILDYYKKRLDEIAHQPPLTSDEINELYEAKMKSEDCELLTIETLQSDIGRLIRNKMISFENGFKVILGNGNSIIIQIKKKEEA